jgi:hypothetical protein
MRKLQLRRRRFATCPASTHNSAVPVNQMLAGSGMEQFPEQEAIVTSNPSRNLANTFIPRHNESR